MKVRLKLFASLGAYLPPGARHNSIDLVVPEGVTPAIVMAQLAVPRDMAHLVFVDGVHQFPEDIDTRALKPGETLAIWPPIAGG